MKKNNKKINLVLLISIILLVITQLTFLLSRLGNTNFYELILFLFGIPIVFMCFAMLIIGRMLLERKIIIIYSVIYSTFFSLISNLLPAPFLTTSTIEKIVERTDVKDGLTININSGVSFGQVVSTIFLYIIIASLAGLVGSKLKRRKR